MILADKREYQKGYKKHLAAYRYLKKNNDAFLSRCLLLTYSVECGLKYLLLDQWRLDSPEEIVNDKNDKRRDIIKSHNLQEILAELGMTRFSFPRIKTVHKDSVSSGEYHLLYRYAIKAEDHAQMLKCEKVLNDIIEYLEEEIEI